MRIANHKAPRFRLWVLVVSLFLVAAAFFFFWSRSRSVPLDVLAERYAHDFVDGDVDALLPYIPQYELDKLGMTREEAGCVLREVVLPKIGGLEFVGVQERVIQAGGMSGIVFYNLKIGTTEKMFAVDLEKSDEGPIRRLRRILADAWNIDYYRKNPDATDDMLVENATLDGLLSDRVALEKCGCTGLVKNDEAAPATTFDDAIRILRERNEGK